MKAGLNSGSLLDPRLVSYFKMITRIMYFDGKKSGTTVEIEVPLSELISGMQISRDLTNAGGVLLLQKGDMLDAAGIGIIRRNSKINPSPTDGVWMYVGTTANSNPVVALQENTV